LVAEKVGFCFGVQRAYDLALSSAEAKDGPLFSWGPLIHNYQVVRFLEGKGLKVISDLNEVGPGARVVVRSHGASPRVWKELESRGAQIIDATCPFVKKAQNKLSQLEGEGYQVLLLGDRSHAEVQTLIGYARSEITVVQSPADLNSIELKERVGLLSQTTRREADLEEIAGFLLPRVEELKVFNTICKFTIARSKAALQVAKEVDVLFVVGGKDSANTSRLRDSCREVLPDTYLIEAWEEIDAAWLHQKSRAGITSGASTPDWVIAEVVARLKDMIL
jgi:4-hydroxy-3-methylbut-2-enyl diphosphate reductase